MTQATWPVSEESQRSHGRRGPAKWISYFVTPPYGTNLTESLDRYVRFHQMSSTTGRPPRRLDTSESWEWMRGAWREIWAQAGVGTNDRLLCAFSFGPFIGFWLGFEAAQQLESLGRARACSIITA